MLAVDTQQVERIRACLCEGAALASASLRADESGVAQVDLVDLHACVLTELPEDALCGAGDRVACVSRRLPAPLGGTGLFVMEPLNAFAWVQGGPARSTPVERFVAAGSRILGGFARAAGDVFDLQVGPGDPTLEEQPIASILVSTHAPADTWVLSARLRVRSEAASLPSHLYLLLAPKQLGFLLEGLA